MYKLCNDWRQIPWKSAILGDENLILVDNLAHMTLYVTHVKMCEKCLSLYLFLCGAAREHSNAVTSFSSYFKMKQVGEIRI